MTNGRTKEQVIKALDDAIKRIERLEEKTTDTESLGDLKEQIGGLRAKLQELEEKEKPRGETDDDFEDW